MVQPWIFVSPASRGIGLQLTRRLLATTNLPVVATARTKLDHTRTQILKGLEIDHKRLHVLQVDVTGDSKRYTEVPRSETNSPARRDHRF